MARFGLFIGLVEIPMEMIVGKMGPASMFVAGGLGGALMNPYRGMSPFI